MKSYPNPKTLECRFEETSEGEGESVKGFGDGSVKGFGDGSD